MGEEEILLKLKRDFTQNEAVQLLLKMLSESEVEVGKLKSEITELQYKEQQLRTEERKTKKQWMKDEMFVHMNQELETARRKSSENSKEMQNWRNKYFSLLASSNNNPKD